MGERRTFLVRAMSEGLRWLWRLLTHVLSLITLVAVVAGVVLIGVLLKQPAWLLAGIAVLAVFAVFFEGAYRVWREADNAGSTAEVDLGLWLDERSGDIQALAKRLREKIAQAPVLDVLACQAIEESFWKVSGEVLTRLHIDSPEWAEYYMEDPPDAAALSVVPIQPEQFEERARAMDFTVDQIEHIRARLR